MSRQLYKAIILLFLLSACNPFSGPRNVDWKKEWEKHASELKSLTKEVKENKEAKYQVGNNSFSYPFNDGFYIGYGSRDTLIDTNNISIRYYVDRGLLDHFSAFIYTRDSSEIKELEVKVQQGGNDFKIEDNWYMIND
jgi:hypothetical protein